MEQNKKTAVIILMSYLAAFMIVFLGYGVYQLYLAQINKEQDEKYAACLIEVIELSAKNEVLEAAYKDILTWKRAGQFSGNIKMGE